MIRCRSLVALVLFASVVGSGAAAPVALDARAAFDLRGASIRTHRDPVAIALAAFGRPGAMIQASPVEPRRVGDEVRYARGPGVVEWWRGLPEGLEQGVTLAERPPGHGTLRLEMSTGSASARLRNGETVELVGHGGTVVATYAALVVVDATGARIPAWLDAMNGDLAIVVDDRDAHYPLVVDPLVATMEASRPLSWAATALSGDGEWAFLYGRTAPGGREVLHRTGTAWAVEADPAPCSPTAASEDGNRILCASGDVWTRLGTGWSRDMGTPTASSPFGGTILADMSRDGLTLVYFFSADAGRPIEIYERRSTSWSLTSTITPLDDVGAPTDVDSLAMAADGLRVIVVTDFGDALVHVRGATTWPIEGLLTTSLNVSVPRQAISGDGAWVVLTGSCRSFGRTGSTWREYGTLPGCGGLVELNATGTRAITGDGTAVGVYRRTGTTWSTSTTFMPGRFETMDASSSGDRVILGGRFDDPSTIHRLGADGDACTDAADCVSGFCSDDVCCDTDCGSSDTDCRACSVAEGTASDGACGPVGAAAAVVCRPSTAPCDAAETCDGTDVGCPADRLAAAGSECAAASGDLCDAPDVCDGTSPACPAAFLTGVVCRDALAPCDIAEVCSGTSASCPPDGLLAAGITCRASTEPACDPEESCDGLSAACPANVTSCVRDGGTGDAAGASDAATPTPTASGGCGCRAGSPRRNHGFLLLLAGVAAIAHRTRRGRSPRRADRSGPRAASASTCLVRAHRRGQRTARCARA